MNDETLNPDKAWERMMEAAIREMLNPRGPYDQHISREHLEDTPKRVVKAFKEYFSGCTQDPTGMLVASKFPASGYSQMIHVKSIIFNSMCAHHFALFTGTVHFAYIPIKHIVGLSKIARLVEILSKRPQVQENLTDQIVDIFTQCVLPSGCGVFVTASHSCMQCRGVRSQTAVTDTLALRGSFLENPSTRQEFLMAVYSSKGAK